MRQATATAKAAAQNKTKQNKTKQKRTKHNMKLRSWGEADTAIATATARQAGTENKRNENDINFK